MVGASGSSSSGGDSVVVVVAVVVVVVVVVVVAVVVDDCLFCTTRHSRTIECKVQMFFGGSNFARSSNPLSTSFIRGLVNTWTLKFSMRHCLRQ